jgi:Protein of unknown function (DUF2934)
MAKSTKRTTAVTTMPRRVSTRVLSQSTNPSDTDIAQRAFELYCERGCQDGHHVEDWLRAERELQETARSTAA